ncbi:arylsulfatase A [Catalinimonas alkaloidigena]|uniref:sulfatase-like hydrolase/transferase n=1 Tax=Catalinimonas alkaloidigena TaxID=1075417 RepID=UPI002405AB0B|nr:sulfatase-like hydrolase/transferase [Catalinimonas alkaloidigena]MDF9799325.1 arylsulfatase A [Catalinimonas alkaloidigena]
MRIPLSNVLILFLSFACCYCSSKADGPPDADRPNIVLIMADDLGYHDLACYGNTKINTPNIDALAEAGLRLTNFHSNGVVCSPTRAALLTGLYPQEAGVEGVVTAKSHRDVGMNLDHYTLAEYLKDAGYATAAFGKWHLGYQAKYGPLSQGFDHFKGFVSGNIDYFSHIDQEGYEDWWQGTELNPEEGYLTELITDHGIDFIRAHQDSSFFLYLPHGAPHYPYQGPEDEAERSIAGDFVVGGKREDKDVAYKEMIESLDKNVGRIVQTLEEEGRMNNTLIIFCSDNGATPNVGSNAPYRGYKSQVYEGGHRVPAIFYWKGKISQSVSDELVLSMDIFPTIADLVAEDPVNTEKTSGISVAELLLGNQAGLTNNERTVFWRFKNQKAATKAPWKVVLTPDSAELFNLANDPSETTNLKDSFPEIFVELNESLKNWEEGLTEELISN